MPRARGGIFCISGRDIAAGRYAIRSRRRTSKRICAHFSSTCRAISTSYFANRSCGATFRVSILRTRVLKPRTPANRGSLCETANTYQQVMTEGADGQVCVWLRERIHAFEEMQEHAP